MVHTPDGDVAARYAGLVLQFRGATLADVYAARKAIELAGARSAGAPAVRRGAEAAVGKPRRVRGRRGRPDARVVVLQEQFHRLLVEAAGNQTLTIFEEMIQGIIELHGRVYVAQHFDEPHATKAAKIGTRAPLGASSTSWWSQRHDEATELWERHLVEASDVVLRGADAKTVLDLFLNYAELTALLRVRGSDSPNPAGRGSNTGSRRSVKLATPSEKSACAFMRCMIPSVRSHEVSKSSSRSAYTWWRTAAIAVWRPPPRECQPRTPARHGARRRDRRGARPAPWRALPRRRTSDPRGGGRGRARRR